MPTFSKLPQTSMRSASTVSRICTSVLLGSALALTACSGGSEPVKAVDRVDEAAEQARANAPVVEVSEPATVEAVPQPAEDTSTPMVATETADTAVAAAPAGAHAGEALYESTCKTCHITGMLESPKIDDKAAWAPRIAQGKEALYQSVINGKGNMPPRGASSDASDEEIKAAVDFMVDKVS